MKKLLLLIGLLFLTTPVFAALTKSVATVDNFTAIAQNAVTVGATNDITANYQTTVNVDACLTTGTATTNGMLIVVQGANNANDNFWFPIAKLTVNSGTTATGTTITDNPVGAGTALIHLTSATGFAIGKSIYIKDNTIGNSEIRIVTAISGTALTLDTALTSQHSSTTPVWNMVSQTPISIPDSTNRIRVIYDNTQDSTGALEDVRTSISRITGI